MDLFIQLKKAAPVFLVALVCLGFLTTAQAVVPAPDGGYPGGNTAEGQKALLSLTTGGFNTAVGFLSLGSNATGEFNTAIGAGTLLANTAAENTAIGAGALLSNTNGIENTANGDFALFSNTNGTGNSATGSQVLFNNTTGNFNTAIGHFALFNNTIGAANTAIGSAALEFNTTGNANIAIGGNAGQHLTTESGNIDIDNLGVAGDSQTIRIGTLQTRTFIAAISGTAVTGAGVVVNAQGQLGVATSSARFKDAIKPMAKASEAILALKPVSFRYKKEVDPDRTPQFGLVAEQVEKVNPDLVVRDADGKPYTVRYDAVNAMLLNEFLKEHRAFLKEQRKVEVQEKTIAELKSGMTALAATLKEQASQIQKVTAQLEVSKPAPQVVNNP